MITPKHIVVSRGCLSLLATGMFTQAQAGELLFSLSASLDHRELGSGFATAGDLNGDGVVDVAVADRSAVVSSYLGSGIVHVVSGTDGSLVRSYTGVPAASGAFGSSLVELDADGDGIPDLAVGAPGQSDANGFGAGAIHIYAGATGNLLTTIVGPSQSQFGFSLANAGDLDGDGRDDLYTGAPNADGRKGSVFAVSSGSGSILRTISTDASVSSFGFSVAVMGDIDGDGLADVAIGAPAFRASNGNPVGRVVLVRSSDGGQAAEIVGNVTLSYNHLGESLAGAADANGDGLPDLLVGSFSGGTALLVSGANLSTLSDLSISTLPRYSQLMVGGSLDFDQDGIADWLIGSPGLQLLNGQTVGGIRVVSGFDHSILFESTATASYTGLGKSVKVLPGIGMAAGEQDLRDPVSGGYGAAKVWKVVETPPDSDGDGIIDELDAQPNSIMEPTITLKGFNSGVPNRVNDQGVSLADSLGTLGDISTYRTPALYLAKFNQFSQDLVRAGTISKDDRSAIHAAVVKAMQATH